MQDCNDCFRNTDSQSQLRSCSSGSRQSEVTKYISCIFEAEFLMNVAVKSAILFSGAVVACVRPNTSQELSCY